MKRRLFITLAALAVLFSPALASTAFGAGLPQPFVVFASHSSRDQGYAPNDINAAYGISTLHSKGLTGTGTRIGLLELDGFSVNDLTRFDSQYDLPAPTMRRIHVPGGNFSLKQQGEATMDVEWAHAVAPGAALDVYMLKDTNSNTAFWNETAQALKEAAANGDRAISISWGVCSPASGSAPAQQEFSALENQGISVFVSSGDYGALAGPRHDCGSKPAVAYPAADPSVVAVGGTTLDLSSTDTISDQTAWSLSGGGVATNISRPTWQVTPNLLEASFRNAPDVAFDGDPQTGVNVMYQDQWQIAAGTSLGAPCLAAMWSLVEQDAAQSGKTVGAAAPLFYSIGNSSSYHQVFDDITEGGNNKYQAGPGWDAVTGWGTPNAPALAAAALAAS